MRTNVLDSSIAAYHSDKMNSIELTKKIEKYALKTESFTSRMVAEHFEVATATVSGIIYPLVNAKTLIREASKRPCHITGNRVYWLRHKDYAKPVQQRLFN